jgi:hypothetical protein
MKDVRVIAFYLPQFHPIPENDKWWGKGFTEWTNVAKATPQYKGHIQPKVPADLGFYDLRLPESRQAQADLAREYGIEGFCYWHYWFGNGNQLLQRPFEEVLESGEPDFPFCLGWANHSWSNKTWNKNKAFQSDTMFMEQTYGDEKDYRIHFEYVLRAFQDSRYITVDGKPLFYIHDPLRFEGVDRFIELWRKWAVEAGLSGIYFVGHVESVGVLNKGIAHDYMGDAAENYKKGFSLGLDAINSNGMRRGEMNAVGKMGVFKNRVLNHLVDSSKLELYDYKRVMEGMYTDEDSWENVFPTVIPRWDRTPRRGRGADVFVGETPELFEETMDRVINIIGDKESEHRIIFLRAWNEWGEGNFMEPDLQWGRGFLDALKRSLGK